MLTNASIKSDLAVVREALAHITREYRPSDAALDRLAAHIEALEARVREMEAQVVKAHDIGANRVINGVLHNQEVHGLILWHKSALNKLAGIPDA